MKRRAGTRRGRLAAWIAGAACLALASLIWFGYRAIAEWQRTEELLGDRRARETVDLLVTALSRDMRGVQHSILTEWWERLAAEPGDELRNSVAGAFARYPYPESFFSWRSGTARDGVTFFNRADRPPAWLPATDAGNLFPVTIANHRAVSAAIFEQLDDGVKEGRRFSVFELPLADTRYQFVVRLYYRDAFREELDGIVGFTVNLPWVRQHYFPQLARQVTRIGTREPFAIVDGRGRTVAGTARNPGDGPTMRRWFPLLFIDPLLVGIDSAADLSHEYWAVQVGLTGQQGAAGVVAGPARLLALGAMAAAALFLGLLLTARAARASERVAEMRSEFVSTVTHELKSPIATIRAAGETMVRGRVTDAAATREYAQIVVQESKRLTRLVENLLAYARVTDVAEIYAFDALNVQDLVDDVLRRFRGSLDEAGFTVRVELPADLPPVRGDRTALVLAFDNIVDNAIRYSGTGRDIDIRATVSGALVQVEVRDRGIGIPRDELDQVTRKFFRGRGVASGGSGLGLAIVQRIIADHSGTLTIDSTSGAGTIVTLSLPVASPPVDAPGRETPA